MSKTETWRACWKEFINEGVTTKKVALTTINRLFKHFHLSDQFLGEPTFTFTPRTPRSPWEDHNGDVIEDNFTDRVSTAPTINLAAKALGDKAGFPTFKLYVYAADFVPGGGSSVKATTPRVKGCPKTALKSYGPGFILDDWLEDKVEDGQLDQEDFEYYTDERISPKDLPPELMDDFQDCVPDAPATKETWVLEPTDMLFLGRIDKGGLLLSTAAKEFFKQHKQSMRAWAQAEEEKKNKS